jgi:hypothetical protein
MENKKNKGVVWIIIILALIVIGIVVFSKGRSNSQYQEETQTTIPEGTEDLGTQTNTGSGLTYQQAIVKYAGRLIQINDACQATPPKATFKNGTSIMIDNRSKKAHTFKLDSTFSVKAYGFKIITLSSSTLPKTLLLDCDTSQNVATVLIQK